MRKLKPDRLVLTHLYTSRALPMEAMEKAAHRVAEGCEVQSIPDVKQLIRHWFRKTSGGYLLLCGFSVFNRRAGEKISRTGFDSTARMV